MSVFKTTKGRAVAHCHVPSPPPCNLREVTAKEVKAARAWMKEHFPDAIEVRPPTFAYNCFGYALAESHGWFLEAQPFFDDDFFDVPFDQPQVGDVLVYMKKTAVAHTAVVTRVDGDSITELQSKWGAMPEVLHTLTEVPAAYGKPAFLLRRTEDSAPHAMLTGESERRDEQVTQEAVRELIERLSEPDVYVELMLASTEEVRRTIIETLPWVRDLIAIGPKAEKAVLEFFSRDETQNNDQLSGIALYLLQRIPSEKAVRPLARYIRSGKVPAINRDLAAQAFLTSADIDVAGEDPVSVAFNMAERFL